MADPYTGQSIEHQMVQLELLRSEIDCQTAGAVHWILPHKYLRLRRTMPSRNHRLQVGDFIFQAELEVIDGRRANARH